MSNDWGFGIVRPRETGEPRALIEELCRIATDASGIALVPFLATDYHELADGLEDGGLGIAWLPPIPTIDLEAKKAASMLAIPTRRGSTSYHAALIVRRGGPRSIEELKGRRVAWVQRDSAAGYLVPRMHLAAAGHDVLRFFARELFVHSHTAVVDAVVNGEADVGATFCNVDDTGRVVRSAWVAEDGAVIRPLETLLTIGPIPNDALVASNVLPANARTSLLRWLLSLEGDIAPSAVRARTIFRELLSATDFRVPASAHYRTLEHAVRAARARGTAGLPPSSRMRVRVTK